MSSVQTNSRLHHRQQGAAMVETAIVIVVFLMLVFGIIEFGRAIFEWSRLVEATRAGTRYAIVNDPACNIFGLPSNPGPDEPPYLSVACPDGPLDCDGGLQETTVVVSGSCNAANDAGCGVVEAMLGIQPLVETGNVQITYACTGTGAADLSVPIPSVTVEAVDVQYQFAALGMLRLREDQFTVTMPSFKTTRTGEDMETVN